MLQEFFNMYGMEIISTILTALAGYIGLGCKRLYNKYINDKIKQDVVFTCVKAIEQLYKDIHGEEKKQLCLEYISEVLGEKGIKVGEVELEVLIESAVQEFNKNRGE